MGIENIELLKTTGEYRRGVDHRLSIEPYVPGHVQNVWRFGCTCGWWYIVEAPFPLAELDRMKTHPERFVSAKTTGVGVREDGSPWMPLHSHAYNDQHEFSTTASTNTDGVNHAHTVSLSDEFTLVTLDHKHSLEGGQ